MTGFVIGAVLAVLLVVALLLRPFVWKPRAQRMSHRQMNAAVYREQLAKLEQDLAEGTLGQDDYAQARDDLQRRALEDIREDDAAPTLRAPRKTMLAVTLVVPLAAVGLYMVLGNPGALTESGAAARGTPPDIERMVAGLAAKLEQNPNDLQGWAMLARSYKVMGRSVDAEKAYERAGAALDNDAQLLASYADVAATNANGNFAGKPVQLIQKALKVDPNNPMALWLAGTAALSSNDFDGAIHIWERLAKLLPPGSEDARNLQGAIEEVRAKSGGKSTEMAAAPGAGAGTAVAAADPVPAANTAPPAAAKGAAASVTGTVDLDASIKAKAAPTDTVMVIARVPGTRMPVAVLRVSATELPLKFILDDSLAMSPQARISSASQVEVEARISKSGQAKPEPGDLMSTVQTVKVGASGVALHVTQVRP
jgi:cytochrome c-type biogenesis protein CcmH